MSQTFTPAQMKQFMAFWKVRKAGRYNMASPQAADAAGLDKEEHIFILKNFMAMRVQAVEEGYIL